MYSSITIGKARLLQWMVNLILLFSCCVANPVRKEYRRVEKGALYSLDYRIFFENSEGKLISPWHDIPLHVSREHNTYLSWLWKCFSHGHTDKIFNMVVEIPRGTNAKMEIATKERMSPIRQDAKKGVPRFVDDVPPDHGYPWNYGALPQTWEDPHHIDPRTNAKGDNDPIDVLEIGSKTHERGAIIQVKILGVLAMIDEHETDWKLISIDTKDELAPKLNSIADVEQHLPGLLNKTREWLRVYKMPTGKPANEFAFNEEYQDSELAVEVIEQTHQFWKALIKSEHPEPLNTECHVEGAAFPADQSVWEDEFAKQPEHIKTQPMHTHSHAGAE